MRSFRIAACILALWIAPAHSADRLPRADRILARAYRLHKTEFEVTFSGTVVALLPTDRLGDRHQQFLVKLSTDQTLLIAHNIDLAPRVPKLRKGSRVRIRGEYIWSRKGGIVHFTHHDPRGVHPAGWIKFDGKTFQ